MIFISVIDVTCDGSTVHDDEAGAQEVSNPANLVSLFNCELSFAEPYFASEQDKG